MRKAVMVAGAAPAGGHYSHAVVANGFVFVSGQGPVDPATGQKPDGFAEQVRKTLSEISIPDTGGGLRVEVDMANERMQKKIRDAQLQKIPYMLVVGEREAAEGKVAVRLRSGKDLGAMPLELFVERIRKEAESRHDVTD